MQRDAILIPIYQRPEFLHACLSHILLCEEAKYIDVIICADNHAHAPPSTEYRQVIEKFQNRLHMQFRLRIPHAYCGNSFNVLMGYAEAFLHRYQYIFLIEEDVMIGSDHFRWHYAVQEKTECFCSVAVQNQRRSDLRPCLDPALFYLSASDYASLAVCWKRDNLQAVLRHAAKPYFSDMANYVARTFRASRFRKEHCEQDGLILRVMEQEGRRSAWPYLPRAFHSGWYGYNRSTGVPLTGDLQERILQLNKILTDSKEINSRNPDFTDIAPCSLSGNLWDELRLDKVYP